MTKKVLLIILDGARLDVIEKWVKEGAMPNLQRLIENGVSGNLKSIFPIHTMLAFAALLTGKNPGKNGIYDMQLQKPGTYKLTVPNSTHIKSKTIFEIVSDSGQVIGSINIPLTYPPQSVNGIIVCSWLTPPFANYTYPRDVAKILNKMGYKIQPSVVERGKEFEKEVYETTEKRFQATKWFMQNYNWSLTAVLITGTEHMHHNYAAFLDKNHPDYSPKQEEIVKRYYSLVDKEIGKLLKFIDEDTIIFVISDHGFCPSYGEIYLNSVLQKYGYFKEKRVLNLSRKLFQILESSGIANKLRNMVKFNFFRFVPKRMKNFINESRAESINADWQHTYAYCTGLLGGIRINLKGREPNGIVNKEDYERMRNEIIEVLKNDKNIGNLIKRIWKREKLFKGPYVKDAPDLYVEFKKCYTASPTTSKQLIGRWKKIGFHTLYGMFIAYGKDVKKRMRMNVKIVDIAPTVLHILDVALPDDIDGRVLKDIFEKNSELSKKKIKFQKVEEKKVEVERTKEEEELVKERLRALGYI